jgi:hypothetical protein
MKFKHFFLLALLLPSAVPFLAAQDKGDVPQVSLTIDFVAWGEDLHGLEVRTGKDGKPVSALAFRYSEPYKYTGPQILTLAFGEIPAAVAKQLDMEWESRRRRMIADGLDDPGSRPQSAMPPEDAENPEEIPEILAQARIESPDLAAVVKLPANSKRVTILLAPGPQRSLIPRFFDDDPSRHPAGTVRLHNLSAHPISMRTPAGLSAELAPGKSLNAAARGGKFTYELSYQKDGKWKVQENNLVTVRPTERLHMIVLRSKVSFFSSSDGSRGGFMQSTFLRRPEPASE